MRLRLFSSASKSLITALKLPLVLVWLVYLFLRLVVSFALEVVGTFLLLLLTGLVVGSWRLAKPLSRAFVRFLEAGPLRLVQAGLDFAQSFYGRVLDSCLARPATVLTMTAATLGQSFAGQAAVVFAWSCIPYRAEWRYLTMAHKNSLLDVGHIGQNLYLACQAAGLGTCAIAAYDQNAMDGLLALDGTEEYTVYLSPVGRR